MTYFSVNFTRFALLSQQRFDDRSLLKLAVSCLICRHFESPEKKIYFCRIRINFAINHFRAMQSVMFMRRKSEKNYFAFFKTNFDVHFMTLIHTRTHEHTHTHTYTYIYIYIYIYIYVCVCVFVSVGVSVCYD